MLPGGQQCSVENLFSHFIQLPPALHHNLKRRVIERFKKSLFSQQSNPCNLKSEIKKVCIVYLVILPLTKTYPPSFILYLLYFVP
jgi:hypothetical protein